MYVVKFIRNDGNPPEEYYYRDIEDAIFHFSLFENDDSGLYSSIAVVELEQEDKS